MAETLYNAYKPSTSSNALPDPSDPPPSSGGPLFNRKIEFHLARKPFTGFSNDTGGFKLETLNPTRPDPQRAGGSNQGSGYSVLAGKKPDGSDFLDFGLDHELRFGITFRRIGAGLENLGNTCFLNSVLQCLTYTEPLAAYLQSGKHQNSCRTAGFCALCAIQRHVSRALQLHGRSLAPKDLVSNLRCISRSFRNARQEDAHEYMVNLLESMHKCCLPVGVPSESPSAYEKSLVHRIFGGRLRSQVKCVQCSFCSDKFDPFLDLSLEIVKAESLNKALSHFTAKEYLDGGERQYQCQKCKHKVKALKQLTIHQAPHVLTIHLKRFGAHQPGQKIDKKVVFGPALDLKPFVTGPYDGGLKYTLYGVLVHAGWSTHSGHYYCYIRTSSGMWYSLDDHQVRQVSEKVVLEQKAYMLFYVRDRTNYGLDKQVGFVQKESVITNAIGNKMHAVSNQVLKKTVQNGANVKAANGMDSSAAATRNDDMVTVALKEKFVKEASIQKTEGPPVDISFKMPVSSNAVQGVSILHLNGEQFTQSACIKGSDSTVNNASGAKADGKTSDSSKERGTKEENAGLVVEAPNSKVLVTMKDPSNVNAKAPKDNDTSAEKDQNDSFSITPGFNGNHSSAGDSCITEKTPQKINIEPSLQDSGEKNPACIDHVKSLDNPSRKNNLAKGLSKEIILGNGVQRKGDIKLAVLSGPQPAAQISSPNGDIDRRCQRKPKKKLPNINSVHLGSNLLFGAYLNLQKKKHKKIKRRIVKITSLSEEHLVGMKSTQSTSEITRTLSVNGTVHSRGIGFESCSSKNFGSSNGVLTKGVIEEEFGKRIGPNGTVLTTERPPHGNFSTPLAENQLGVGRANGSKESNRDLVQNGLMSMLTRGLEEKTVARWDGVELPSSQITESSGVESVRVGYIGDEWDEEYDRGKRKKVRISQNVFGGPNLFQEIASKKAKLKKVKMDQSSSGNRPFRI